MIEACCVTCPSVRNLFLQMFLICIPIVVFAREFIIFPLNVMCKLK